MIKLKQQHYYYYYYYYIDLLASLVCYQHPTLYYVVGLCVMGVMHEPMEHTHTSTEIGIEQRNCFFCVFNTVIVSLSSFVHCLIELLY